MTPYPEVRVIQITVGSGWPTTRERILRASTIGNTQPFIFRVLFVRVFKLFVAFAVALYLLLLAIFFATQRSLLYYPNRSYVPLPDARVNRSLQEIAVRTSDGLDLKGWYAPATTRS